MLYSDWKYKITITDPNYDIIAQWCNRYIGDFETDWNRQGIDISEYIVNGDMRTTWYFKQEEHAIMFKLRWV